MHHDRLQAGITQEDDVFGESLLKLRRGHRVAAVLHDNNLAVKALQPRERVDQSRRLLRRETSVVDHEEYAEFSST